MTQKSIAEEILKKHMKRDKELKSYSWENIMGTPGSFNSWAKVALAAMEEYASQKKEKEDVEKLAGLCNDPECKFCGGTGEIKMDNPTTCKYTYCYHYNNGTMSAMPHREEMYNAGTK